MTFSPSARRFVEARRTLRAAECRPYGEVVFLSGGSRTRFYGYTESLKNAILAQTIKARQAKPHLPSFPRRRESNPQSLSHEGRGEENAAQREDETIPQPLPLYGIGHLDSRLRGNDGILQPLSHVCDAGADQSLSPRGRGGGFLLRCIPLSPNLSPTRGERKKTRSSLRLRVVS